MTVIHVAGPDPASVAYLMQASVGRFRAHLISHTNGRWELEIEQPDSSDRAVADVLDAVASWLTDSQLEVTADVDDRTYVVRRDGWTRLRG